MTHPRSRPWLVPAILAGALALLAGPSPAQEPRTPKEASPAPSPPQATPRAEATPDEALARRGPRPGDLQKVFVLQHVDPEHLARLLAVFPAQISWVSRGGLSALAVSAKPAVLSAIEETVKRLDQPGAESERPGSSFDLTGYVLEGLAEPKGSEPLPSELEGVVAQLRRTFRYPEYRLLDTVVARARGDSSFDVEGMAEKDLFSMAPSYYQLSASRTRVVGDPARVVQLTNLTFKLQIPVPIGPPPSDNDKPRSFQYKHVGLRSDIDLRDGQYVVVGKSGLGDSDSALVLVLTAKIVD